MVQFDDTFDADRMLAMRQAEEESLIKALAVQHGYDYVDLRGISISPSALETVPEQQAKAANLVPFEKTRRNLTIAIRNPNNPATHKVLNSLTDQKYVLTIVMTSTASLEHAWSRYKDLQKTEAVKHGVLDIDPARIAEQMQQFTNPELVAETLTNVKALNNARRISETLESMFAGALALRASDIHIEPEAAGIRLRYRLDGVLHDITDLDRSMYDRLLSRLKLLSGMILNHHDEAQDGRFTFTAGEQNVEVRSSIIPGSYGESMVMRLLDPSVATFQFKNLGLNARMQAVMEAELDRPNGLIITTGPTGSGKTTALYAFLQEVHTPERKIITIENPVEYKLDDIVQTQVGDDYTFASGLRAVLRQDPDVIMVGEIRDREVAETAIHAAQTGHLVFSTLHSNSAVGAFPRLMDLGVDYRSLGASLNIALGQRLVRRLCKHCKTPRTATPEEMATIEMVLKTHPEPPQFANPATLYDAPGCSHCNQSGYKGRQGIYEAIRVDDAVEEAIIRDPREHVIQAAAEAQGIPSMAEDGMEKVLDGITSLTELQRVVDLTHGRHITAKEKRADDGFADHIV